MSDALPLRASMRTAAILAVFAVVFTALMAVTYQATRAPIEASAERQKLTLVNEVLPPQSYDNALLKDYVELPAEPRLGLDDASRVFRARHGGRPVALVLEATAPDGYGGAIGLLVAVRADGTLSGVRVTRHKETPGLGDYIDPAKDRNKARPWIAQFDGKGFADIPPAQWKVGKDGGRFAQRAGATISARAVTRAVGRALAFAVEHRNALFAAPAGGKLTLQQERPS